MIRRLQSFHARVIATSLFALTLFIGSLNADDRLSDQQVADQAVESMTRATQFMTESVAVHGGYVYSVSLDLKSRRGEGIASPTEIWVQPPGTPTVGTAFLNAWKATRNPEFQRAAVDCAQALIHGQLLSGGWSDRVDFDPAGKNTGLYRNGKGKSKGRNYSTLDDDKSQSALCFLIQLDQELGFKNSQIHEAVAFGLESLLKAQFANGGFPQGWQKPVEPGIVTKASYPEYEWRTEGRFKDYWDFETLNDGLAGTVTRTLDLAWKTYKDERYRASLVNFGDFLIHAQMPEPQPAWAQQYNHNLQPIWARKFEPPAIAGRESEDVIETLLFLTDVTGEKRFLEPIPAAIAWLKRSQLPDSQLARFYELKTNKPLYLTKDTYELTYDDTNLPTHYGFKSDCRVAKLEAAYRAAIAGEARVAKPKSARSLRKKVDQILAELDSTGRWVTDDKGKPIANSATGDPARLLIESKVFSSNLTQLSAFIEAVRRERNADGK
jgi:PelA/Pel-15E family pectate lyase